MNGSPVPVSLALAREDLGDLPVGVVLGEAADQFERILSDPPLLGAARVQLDRQLGARAALPGDLDVGAPLGGVDGDDDVADQRAQELLAVAVGRRLGVPEAREVTREPRERAALLI